MRLTNRSECFQNGGVGNMHAIPGYQEVHAVHGCDCNVSGVGGRAAWDLAGREDGGGQFGDLRRDVE